MNFVCSDTTAYDPLLVTRLSARFALSPVAVRALLRRNLNTPEAIEAFLHPEAQPLPDWREMKGMTEAARLILRHKDGNQVGTAPGQHRCIYVRLVPKVLDGLHHCIITLPGHFSPVVEHPVHRTFGQAGQAGYVEYRWFRFIRHTANIENFRNTFRARTRKFFRERARN